MTEPLLDEWLERLTRPSPATRAKRQVRALRANTRRTLQAVDTHPHDQQTPYILAAYKRREQAIMQWGSKPPPKRCRICGKVLPGPPVNFWTNNPGLKLAWAILVAVLILMLFPFIGWWVLLVFPIGWAVSLSFFWTITGPSLIAFFLFVVLAATGNLG
jgi:hypothetical protein